MGSPTDKFMGMNPRHVWRILGSIAISLTIIGLLWHWVDSGQTQARFSFHELWAGLPLSMLAVYFAAALAQTFFRALRYRLLISAHQPEDLPGLGHIYLVALIRNMLVDLFPARLGELSYIAMMNRRYRVNAGACVSSLTLSFVFDLIALLILVVGLMMFQRLHAELVGRLPVAILVLILVSAAAIVGIYPFCRWVTPKASSFLLRPSAGNGSRRLGRLVQLINAALQSTARIGILLPTLGYALAIRCIKYGGLYALFIAVAGSLGDAGAVQGHGVGTVLTALLSAEGAASLPVPAFMGFGTYEAGGTAALTLLGISAASGLVIMLAIHILSQIIDYSLGALATIIFLVYPARPTISAAPK